MATITPEDALSELKARGVDPANPPAAPDTSQVNRQAAIAELQRRGINIPTGAPPQLNSPYQPTPAQQKQYPIGSAVTKALGPVMEAAQAPFDAVGEAMRVAGEGAPPGKVLPFLPKLATAQDPTGFRAPTIIQRLSGMLKQPNSLGIPNMTTPEAPANPFTKAYQGLEGLVQPNIQQAAQAVTGKPDLAAGVGGTAIALGTGEAGNLPFTAAIKPFASIGKLLETGHLGGVPGSGMAMKAAGGVDAVPIGLENLTAHANAEVLEAATKNNVPATPGMLTGSPTLNAMESFGKKLPFASNIFQKRFAQIYDAMNNMRAPIVETAKPAAELGLDAQAGLTNASDAAYQSSKSLYQGAANALPDPNAQIPLNGVAESASTLMKSQAKLPPGAQSAGAMDLLRNLAGSGYEGKNVGQIMAPGGKAVAGEVTGSAVPAYDYQTVLALRAELNNKITNANAALKSASPGAKFQSSPEAGIYGKLKDALDQDLNSFADQTGGDFKSKFSEATKTYQAYKQTFANDKFVQSILNEQNPENVVNKLVSAAKNNPRALGMMKLSLPPETVNDLQTHFIKDMSEKDPNIFSPSYFAKQYDSIGEKQLTTILGPDKVAQLRPLYALSKAGMNAESAGQAASGPSGAGVGSSMMLRGPIMAFLSGAAGGKLLGGGLKASALAGAMMEGLPLGAKAYLSGPVGKVLTRQVGMVPSFPTLGAVAPLAAKLGGSINAISQNPQAKQALLQILQRLKQGGQAQPAQGNP